MDDVSLREVVRYLQQHFSGASIELSHTATASEQGFKIRGAVMGDLFIRSLFFPGLPGGPRLPATPGAAGR